MEVMSGHGELETGLLTNAGVSKTALKRQMGFNAQVPFKHESLLADKEEQKLTKAEKREAKRGLELRCSIV